MNKQVRALAIGGFLFSLVACSAVQKVEAVSDAQTAIDKTATAVATIGSKSASALTKAQAAACAGQAIANTVTDMLTDTGHTAQAASSAKVSAALGQGCTF